MKRILVINNDIDTMDLLKSWLEKKLYKVKFTSSCDGAISLAEKFNPSLIIIDILQRQTLLAIKANPKIDSIPLLLMSGYAFRSSNNQLPVDDIIEKPFDLRMFEQKVKTLIGTNVEEQTN